MCVGGLHKQLEQGLKLFQDEATKHSDLRPQTQKLSRTLRRVYKILWPDDDVVANMAPATSPTAAADESGLSQDPPPVATGRLSSAAAMNGDSDRSILTNLSEDDFWRIVKDSKGRHKSKVR